MLRISLALVVLCSLAAPAAGQFQTGHLDSDAEFLALFPDVAAVAEGRIGDLGGAATFEQFLGQDTALPGMNAQYAWPNGTSVPFTLVYDANTNVLTYTLDGQVLTYEPMDVFTTLFLRTRAVEVGTSVLLDDLVLDGVVVGDVSEAVGDGTDYLVIEDADPILGFELEGTATLSWTSSPPSQSRLAFEIKLGRTNEPVSGAPVSFGAQKGAFVD